MSEIPADIFNLDPDSLRVVLQWLLEDATAEDAPRVNPDRWAELHPYVYGG